jgi:hypothetical protein
MKTKKLFPNLERAFFIEKLLEVVCEDTNNGIKAK